MTPFQALEMIRKHHPDMGDTEMLLHMNAGIRDFADDTKMKSEQTEKYTMDGSVAYALPSNGVSEVKHLYCEDDNVFIPRITSYVHEGMDGSNTGKKIWWLAGSNINFLLDSTTLIALTSGINIAMTYVGYPAAITNASTAFDTTIPSEFHMAFADYVIAMGYRSPPNINLNQAAYFEAGYKKLKRKARAYNLGGKQVTATITPHWM